MYFLSSWRCTVIPESLVLLLDGVYSPIMKGANWLKFICHQGRSLVNNFSLCNNWYKSVVLLLIWLHSLVYQIHNKQMSQLVAYSGNICVWVVWCNECGGWQLGRRSAILKKAMVPMATFMRESRSNVVASQYGGLRVSQWHKLCWSRAGVTLAGTTGQPRQSRSFPGPTSNPYLPPAPAYLH